MRAWLAKLLTTLVDVGSTETAFGRYLLEVRYRALQRQIPSLYLIALTSVVGWHVASGISWETLAHPANILVPLVIVRLVHWVRTKDRRLAPERIVRELRTTLVLAAILSALAGYWTINQITHGTRELHDLIILFASLAAIGCAYGLSSFPKAGRLPLIFFALPFSLTLALSPNPAHGVVGVSLAVISMLTLRLLGLHNHGLVELVRSRTAVDAERDRALRAESAALAEQARVREVADTDALTGLPNRRAFIEALSLRLSEPAPFGVMLMDLDGFKPINDVFGHATGDAVLREVARRLKRACRGQHLAARIGGDEFATLIEFPDSKSAAAFARSIVREVGKVISIEGRQFIVSSSGGLMMAEPRAHDVATTLRYADTALYAGKQCGRGKVALFHPGLRLASDRRVRIELELRKPATLKQLHLVYQPIFDLESGRLYGFEALARWRHPKLGEISPSEFIPIAEQIGLIEKVSDALLHVAAREARDWPASTYLSYNLSAVQIGSANSAARLLSILKTEGLSPSKLLFEVTETSLLANFELARRNLTGLQRAGARIALDDFGAGFASISYLREMRFDVLKLDGSLVVRSTECPNAQRLLTGVVELGRSLGVSCVGESVENEAHIRALLAAGCTLGQGFGLAAPLSGEVVRGLLCGNILALDHVTRRPRGLSGMPRFDTAGPHAARK